MMKNELVQTFDEQAARHFRWNFTVNAADFALYSLALSFASLLTILLAFVSKFTSSNLIIGMRPTYIGLTNTVKAPFSAIAPILGGILGDRFQLPFVFLLTAGIVFIGLLVLLLSVKEPRAHR